MVVFRLSLKKHCTVSEKTKKFIKKRKIKWDAAASFYSHNLKFESDVLKGLNCNYFLGASTTSGEIAHWSNSQSSMKGKFSATSNCEMAGEKSLSCGASDEPPKRP